MKKSILFGIVALLMWQCKKSHSALPVIPPQIITEQTPYDSDDPAIWIHPNDPSKSIVYGTDKDTQGGVYAFDLQGKILWDRSITDVARPNNVDIEYGFTLNDSLSTDLLVFTERERQRIRIYSLPDLTPLDGGGLAVFEDEELLGNRLPMGLALYKNSESQKVYAVVGRKTGPSGSYLHQYEFIYNTDATQIELGPARKFGTFSGEKEIEAIAVDNEKGIIYYSDEGVCIRVYSAKVEDGNQELACFGGEFFREDIEGIAIAKTNGKTYLLVSDQQAGEFVVFNAADHSYVHRFNLGTQETDGCEVTTASLGPQFPEGLFVAMNDNRNFYFYDWGPLRDSISKAP